MDENKDYGEYFAKLERELSGEKKENSENEHIGETTAQTEVKPRKSSKKVRAIFARTVFSAAVIAVIAGIVALMVLIVGNAGSEKKGSVSSVGKSAGVVKEEPDLFAKADSQTVLMGDDIKSSSAVFIDIDENRICAKRASDVRCYPASTTKIMTLLVAVENIKDFDDTFKMTYNITDPLYEQDATVAGFISGETITMTDLLYGTILPSGGDAAVALAVKISGSEAEFAKLMNKKAAELGLKNTHFTNCTGLYNKDHYTTAEDLAVILRQAMQDKLCKRVLTAQTYLSSSTPQHPDGIDMLSTLFKYMYGTEAENATIRGGKTGYTGESGYCIATFGISESGKEYVCVGLNAPSRWPAVYDQINLYKAYAK